MNNVDLRNNFDKFFFITCLITLPLVTSETLNSMFLKQFILEKYCSMTSIETFKGRLLNS